MLTRGQTKLTYTIDMEKDIIEKIAFSTNDGRDGVLRFTYLEQVDPEADEFVSPRWRSSGKPQRPSPGMLWLLKPANGEW